MADPIKNTDSEFDPKKIIKEEYTQRLNNIIPVIPITTAPDIMYPEPPQLYATDEVWNYSPEYRRVLGYYTNEERDKAARLNNARSNSFFSTVMPNFGRENAWKNPGGEFDAFNATSTYLPTALVTGTTFGSPSIARAGYTAFKQGLKTAGNTAQRYGRATVDAFKAAAPIVKNPRWAAATAMTTVPMTASAFDLKENSNSNGFITGALATLGVGALTALLLKRKQIGNWLKGKSNSAKVTDPYTYKSKPLSLWERPTKWESKTNAKIQSNAATEVNREWNTAMTESKTKEFKDKYGLFTKSGKKTTYWTDEEVKKALQSKDFSKFTSSKFQNNYILTGPTKRQVNNATIRNIGRILTGIGIGGGVGSLVTAILNSSPSKTSNTQQSNVQTNGGTKIVSKPFEPIITDKQYSDLIIRTDADNQSK